MARRSDPRTTRKVRSYVRKALEACDYGDQPFYNDVAVFEDAKSRHASIRWSRSKRAFGMSVVVNGRRNDPIEIEMSVAHEIGHMHQWITHGVRCTGHGAEFLDGFEWAMQKMFEAGLLGTLEI